jgi:predicted DsbA family dithiol-disulfide isomerase
VNINNPKHLKEKLKIEMVHDHVCSWCPIGYNNIKTAINNLNIEVDFHFLPFELNPDMDDSGILIADYFSRQFHWSESKLLNYQQSLVASAAKAGVCINFSKRTHYYPTKNTHLLMHWVEQFNMQSELNEHLIEAYFKDGEDINNLTILLNIAEKLGFDRQETDAALTSSHLSQILNEKALRYKTFNISSIPAFIINEGTLISGSNSVQYFEDTLSAFINEPCSIQKSTV